MESALVDMRLVCTPEHSVITDRARVGVGEESFTYNAYEWDWEYPGNKTAHFKALFLDDCTPISEMSWFRDLSWNYTTYLTFIELTGLEDKWSPFHQYDKYYRLTRSHRDEWPSIEEDAFRPWHEEQTFHIFKRIQIRMEMENEEREIQGEGGEE